MRHRVSHREFLHGPSGPDRHGEDRQSPCPDATATNFVNIDCGRDSIYARAIVDDLLQPGIVIRMPGVAPPNRCTRVSCGTKRDLDLLAEVLPLVLSRQKSKPENLMLDLELLQIGNDAYERHRNHEHHPSIREKRTVR
jgi:hypothetical protein